jgi:hypothetical protein
MSQRDVIKKTGHSSSTVAKYTKGLRTHEESLSLAKSQGKWELSDEGRRSLQEAGRRACQRTGKCWTKPEKEFKEILNSEGLGVEFPDFIKEIFNLENDEKLDIKFQYPIQRYVCDYVDTLNMIVFSVQGDFWHANPLLYDKCSLTLIKEYF